jgi:hypothetical protein
LQYLEGAKGTKMVEGGKFLTLSDEAFVDLKVEEEDMGMQTNTMPLPSNHSHCYQDLQVEAIKGWQEFISSLEKEMPTSEVKMSFLLKAKMMLLQNL